MEREGRLYVEELMRMDELKKFEAARESRRRKAEEFWNAEISEQQTQTTSQGLLTEAEKRNTLISKLKAQCKSIYKNAPIECLRNEKTHIGAKLKSVSRRNTNKALQIAVVNSAYFLNLILYEALYELIEKKHKEIRSTQRIKRKRAGKNAEYASPLRF